MDFNPYKVLAVDPTADPDVVSAAYRALSKKYHPDINKAPDAEARMRELNRAYDMLKDPEQRKRVDADLARQNQNPRSGATGPLGGYTPPRPAPPSRTRTGTTGGLSNIGEQFDYLRKRAETVINDARIPNNGQNPRSPSEQTLHFYQKQLMDEVGRKSLKVTVYHDSQINRKLCNIRASAPNARQVVTQGEVFLDSERMFDLTLAVAEAEHYLQEPSQPIEMNSDHDVYFRRSVAGMGHTYIAVEVIKRTHGGGINKEALLLLGEKNARTEKDGVIASQTPTQLQQLSRIFKSALEAMR